MMRDWSIGKVTAMKEGLDGLYGGYHEGRMKKIFNYQLRGTARGEKINKGLTNTRAPEERISTEKSRFKRKSGLGCSMDWPMALPVPTFLT